MKSINICNKFNTQNVLELKNSFNCFNLYNNRILEGTILKYNNFSLIVLGFKYVVKTKKPLVSSNCTFIKVIKLETIFNDTYINLINTSNYKSGWYIIKKAFQHRCLLVGTILNSFHNGYSVGICGFVGFMPKKDSIYNRNQITSIFVISYIDPLKKKVLICHKSK